MERPRMRGPRKSKRRCWERNTSRFVSWMHKEGYVDQWDSLRWISQEDIEVCSDDKTGARYAYVSRKNAPYAGGWYISVPGHYRVELKIIKGLDREVGFLSEKCADGFPDDWRNWLKKRFEYHMNRRYEEAQKALEAPWKEWLDREFEREWDERRRERFMQHSHWFSDDSEQLFQTLGMAGAVKDQLEATK